jgi:hypothetical protein
VAAYAFRIKIRGIPPLFLVGIMAGATVHCSGLFKAFASGQQPILVAMDVQFGLAISLIHIYGILIQFFTRGVRKGIPLQHYTSWA